MEKQAIYKCAVCGNVVEVLQVGGGTLTCCKQPMMLLQENSVDASREKHVPVLEKVAGGYKVFVGSAAHPMEEKHYIEWIELQAGNCSYRQFLKPGAAPEAFFPVDAEEVTARASCNLHGVWKGALA